MNFYCKEFNEKTFSATPNTENGPPPCARTTGRRKYTQAFPEKRTHMDTLSPKERSERMGRVKGKDTKPELVVRSLVHGLGFRYRFHAGDLPGKPDLVFVGKRKVIFVHGCFWHRHRGLIVRNPNPSLHVRSFIAPYGDASVAFHFDFAFLAVIFLRAFAVPIIAPSIALHRFVAVNRFIALHG
jgi:DNA mismatch endonuclease Vsr